ncbi:MAG: hypothetical protein R3A11_03870 [Bdellovibrionota bacterium]
MTDFPQKSGFCDFILGSWMMLCLIFCGVSPAHGDALEDQISADLGNYMGIYILNQDQRTPGDRVVAKRVGNGIEAKMFYWRSFEKRDANQEICQAYDWLLFGRTSYGHGAKEAFQKFPQLQTIELHLFDIVFGTQKGKSRGEILPTKKIIEHLRIGVNRSTLLSKNVDLREARKLLDQNRCSEVRKKYFQLYWVNRDYLQSTKS